MICSEIFPQVWHYMSAEWDGLRDFICSFLWNSIVSHTQTFQLFVKVKTSVQTLVFKGLADPRFKKSRPIAHSVQFVRKFDYASSTTIFLLF